MPKNNKYEAIGSKVADFLVNLEKAIEPMLEGISEVSKEFINESDIRIISKEEYDQFVKDSAKLNALESAGVDNWEGYDNAMSSLDGEED